MTAIVRANVWQASIACQSKRPPSDADRALLGWRGRWKFPTAPPSAGTVTAAAGSGRAPRNRAATGPAAGSGTVTAPATGTAGWSRYRHRRRCGPRTWHLPAVPVADADSGPRAARPRAATAADTAADSGRAPPVQHRARRRFWRRRPPGGVSVQQPRQQQAPPAGTVADSGPRTATGPVPAADTGAGSGRAPPRRGSRASDSHCGLDPPPVPDAHRHRSRRGDGAGSGQARPARPSDCGRAVAVARFGRAGRRRVGRSDRRAM